MRRFLPYSIFIGAIILWGCGTAELTSYNIERNGNESRTEKKINVKKLIDDSNPRFIDKALDNIEFPPALTSRLTYKDKIVVMNLERLYNTNKDQQLVVDRFLNSKLLKSNYVVLDRDENTLKISLLENSSRINNYFRLFNDSSMAAIVNSTLQTATRILAYRILELGIIKTELTSERTISRYGAAELELRLIDASSGQLLFSDIVYGNTQDEIPLDDYNIIKDMHFKFENDALPLELNLQPKEWLQVKYEITSTSEITGIKLYFNRGDNSANVLIKDNSSRIVRSFIIPASGPQRFEYIWDLTDSNGKKVPNGSYSIYIDNVYARAISF